MEVRIVLEVILLTKSAVEYVEYNTHSILALNTYTPSKLRLILLFYILFTHCLQTAQVTVHVTLGFFCRFSNFSEELPITFNPVRK